MAESVNYKQLGTTGLKRAGGYVYEEFLTQLRWPRAARVYQEMADNDPTVGAVLYLAEMLIRATEWRAVPGGNTEADKEAAKFLEECMHDMEMSWANTISEVLSMLQYGFTVHEIVYKIRRGPKERSSKYRSKYSDGRIAWRCLPIRAQDTIQEWQFNDAGDIIGCIQVAEPNYTRTPIPISKILLFRTRMSKNNPEGRSLLRNAYRPWFFKKHFEEIEGIGIERDLAGFPVLTAPEGLDLWNDQDPRMIALKANAESLVSNIRRDSQEGVLLPHGWDLTLLTSGSSRQIDIGSTINRYDNRIAITMLSDIILIGGEKSGSFALADTKQSMLAGALQAQLQNIADVFNQKAVADLFLINDFPGITEPPKIAPGQIQTPSLKELALLLRAMNLNIAKDKDVQNYLRQILGMPDLTQEVFEEVYEEQGETQETKAPTEVPDDTTENDMEQNDQAYTGGGE